MLMTRLSHVWPPLFSFSLFIFLAIATVAARVRYIESIGGVCRTYKQFSQLQSIDSGLHILALILAVLGGVASMYHYIVVDARLSQKHVSNQASGHRSFLVLLDSFTSLTHSHTTFFYSPLVYSPFTSFSILSCTRSREEFPHFGDWCTSYHFHDEFVDICGEVILCSRSACSCEVTLQCVRYGASCVYGRIAVA